MSPSYFKKYLKMEFFVLADIVFKAVLVKASTFDKMTKKKVLFISVILSSTKINQASVIFKILTEMLQKKSTSFAVQINKLLQDAAFSFTATSDGTSITMLDAENVVALRLKPYIPEFIVINKEIGDEKKWPNNRRGLSAS